MARARNIKPGFFANDTLAECSPLARLLFAGLWTIADRAGRLEDRPKRIKAALLPYDECDINDLLDQLVDRGFIARYEAGGQKLIQVLAFDKHQNPHKNEPESLLPSLVDGQDSQGNGSEQAPEQHSTSTVQAPEQHSSNRADSLNLIPDSFISVPIGTGADAPQMLSQSQVWKAGVELLAAQGMGESQARAFIGKLAKELGGSTATLGDLVEAVVAEQPADARAWLQAAVKRRKTEKPKEEGRPEWALKAGFANEWEAQSAGCYASNAAEFSGGKRREVAA